MNIYNIEGYIDSIPDAFYEGAGSILLVCLVVSVSFFSVKKGLRISSTVALLEYIALVYCSTVFSRTVQDERKFDFHPFWTYKAILEGKDEFVTEAIMNVIAFIPIGFLLGCSFVSLKWWKVIIIACLFSLGIEILQFIMMRGFSELDDVMHNTLGSMIGYGVYRLVAWLIWKIRTKEQGGRVHVSQKN